jgi:hypothetical protein
MTCAVVNPLEEIMNPALLSLHSESRCVASRRDAAPVRCRLVGGVRTLFAAALVAGVSAARADAPAFTGVADQGLAVSADWSGGNGPFLLQRKLTLSDTNWVNVLTRSGGGVMLPKDAASAFFRLQAQATQIVIPFGVFLEAASEVPPVNSPGASGIGVLSLEGSNLTYHISFSGLSAPASAAHIHGPATPTNAAGVMIGLSVPSAIEGEMSGTLTLTAAQIANLVNGQTYVNIHTANNPGGEIRGQIVPLHVPIQLDGGSEVPPVGTPAIGSGFFTMIGNRFYYRISYSGLTGNATAAHIHGPAATTNSAGVLVGLATPTGTNGTISGWVTLTPLQLHYVLSGLTYVNIHSSMNPGGEIRGQIWPVQLSASLSGAAEIPSVATPATGSAFLTIVNNTLNYRVTFSDLTSNATAAHIHGPASRTQNAGVLIGFSGVPSATAGTISGSAALSALNLFYLISGQTYVNVHTVNFPGGEIRGQVEPAD